MVAAGYALVNADCVLIGQEPRIAPLREAMSERLASALGVERERIGVRATTTDFLGFTGRGEGLAAQAVALLERATRDASASSPTTSAPSSAREPGSSGRRGRAFMLESPISYDRWHLLYERFGSFQFWLVDEATDEILAEGNSLPVRLDLADLPDRGWEYVIEHATNGDEEPTLVSAIQVLVDRNRHGSRPQRDSCWARCAESPTRPATAISWLPCGRA